MKSRDPFQFLGGRLPQDPLESSAKRLGMLGLIAGLVLALNALVDVLSTDITGPPGRGDVPVVLTASVISLALYAVVRWSKLSASALLDIGLVFEVLLAAAISTAEAFNSLEPGDPVWGVSWVCVLVVIFPVLVYHSPVKLIVVSFVATSMGPASYVLAAAVEQFPLSLPGAVEFYTPNYIAYGASVIIIVLLSRLRDELTHARRMGSYQLLERIGEGGMGEVWRAQHGLLSRPAAIKLIHRSRLERSNGSSAEETLERFLREARATSMLESPHSINVYDFGVSKNGVFYYVMELLKGLTLRQLVDQFGPQTDSRVAHMLIQVCESLADAHARGLIHRDIKPANIFLCSKGLLTDYIKVLDFGLVKSTRGLSSITVDATRSGLPLGTPEYLAPEAIRDLALVDVRSDLYSLGCTAYWLLSGAPVFAGESPLSVAVQHASNEPVRPSVVSGIEIHPDLEEIVLSLLRKDPRDRPQSAATLRTMLTELEFDSPWTQSAADAWWNEHLPDLRHRLSGLEAPIGAAADA